MDDLIADFLTETGESMAELDVALVKLEQTPDDAETLSLIFRMVHTIKGTCGFLGLGRLEKVAHAAENVLGKLRDGEMTATSAIVSQILAALDRIKAILADLAANGAEPAGDDSALVAALEAMAAGNAHAGPGRAADDAAGEEPRVTVDGPAVPDKVAALPDRVAIPDGPAVPDKAVAVPVAAEQQAGQTPTIRVTVDVLEDLMTLVSELVLTRNQLLQLARTQENAAFAVPLQRLSHITSDLQEGVMKTRMQPIGMAWNKLPRLVRDLGHELDKKISLVMRGAETELDRQVLELIKDPLTHMVRNSGDHGLETPAERRAAGKVETGTISLNAYHEGGHIVIEIADDGRGLPVEKIRAKVLEKGLATEAELAAMGPEQIQRFIFRAGLSTAKAVTAVSGRGVGMDVVKTNIEKIGGTIDLRSVAGQGSTFTIKIPLTLAIVSALIVQAGGERFAIPQISVVELVHARTDGPRNDSTDALIERINDTPVLRLRERLLPLVNLDELLRLGGGGGTGGGVDVVVAQVGTGMLGIVVDRVFDTEEIVVKPVAPILRHITMFSGNTILGDGSVIMILDPNGIARATGVGAGGEAREMASGTGGAQRSGDLTAMLLFRAGAHARLAVPLGLVARLEDFPRAAIETSAGQPVVQYRGQLMPLIPFAGQVDAESQRQPVLVFTDGDRSMGLMVDAITDVVEARLRIELSGAGPGLLGTAVIDGQATDVIDTGYWLQQAWGDWLHGGVQAGTKARRLLLVDDNSFFRQLLVPMLSAGGYQVTAVESAAAALVLRDGGMQFDVILSDIDMPGMDGIAFARAVRAGGAWAQLPLVALSANAEETDVARGLAAGFTDYIAKARRELLLDALAQAAGARLAGAA